MSTMPMPALPKSALRMPAMPIPVRPRKCRSPAPALATRVAIVVAALGCASSAHAQTDPDKFRAYLASDAYNALVADARKGIPQAVLPTCPSFASPNSTVTIAAPVTFGRNGAPSSGAWWSRSPVSGCGNDTTINILFTVNEQGKITPIVALPGTTNADILLQRDSLMYARVGVMARMPNCKSIYITNTKFESYGLRGAETRDRPAQASPRDPWWETWTVGACGRAFDVPMEFIPDSTGTTINQSPNLIVER